MSDFDAVTLPFQELNLRINPFGALTAEESAKLAVVNIDLNSYARRLNRPGFAIQFFGSSGRGKSTHISVIHAHFPDQPYTYIPDGEPVPKIPDTSVQFIDEMQRIPRSSRLTILKRQASFVIGSHRDHSREFKQAGLEYKVFRLHGLTIDRLMIIVRQRIEWARRNPQPPIPYLTKEAAHNLITMYGDDLWAIENHLYEVFQELNQVGEVTIETPGLGKKIMGRYLRLKSLIDYLG